MKVPSRLAGLILVSLVPFLPASAQSGRRPEPLAKPVRYGIALAPGDAAPTFRGADLMRKPVDVAYDRSRATVVGFWASDVAACRAQSVTLQQLFTQYHAAGVQVLGIAMHTGAPQAPPTEARAFLAELGGTYPVIRSTTEIERVWHGVTVLPLTFLVGKDGKLVRRYVGADDAIMKGLQDDLALYLAGRPLGEQILPQAAPQAAPSSETKPPR